MELPGLHRKFLSALVISEHLGTLHMFHSLSNFHPLVSAF